MSVLTKTFADQQGPEGALPLSLSAAYCTECGEAWLGPCLGKHLVHAFSTSPHDLQLH